MSEVDDVSINSCAGEALVPTAVTVGYNSLGARFTDTTWRQAILSKLDQLLRCCSPCAETTHDAINFVSGLQVTEPFSNLSHVELTITNIGDPSWSYGGQPGFHHFGRYRFYNAKGYATDEAYLTNNFHTILCPLDGEVRLEIYLNPFVEAVVVPYTRNIWTYPSG